MSDQNSLPYLTVVIATRNRRRQLEGCLASLNAQRHASGLFELVVVNDGSTDDTAAFLAGFPERAPFPVMVLNQENTGVAIARNLGVASAAGAILAFTDDDCLLGEDWIATLLKLWEGAPASLGGIGGALDTVCPDRSLAADYLRFLDEFNYIPVLATFLVRPRHKTRLRGEESIAYLRTSNASFRTDAIQRIGGFDPAFQTPGGEDPDLSYRLLAVGYQLRFSPELRVDHLSRADFRAYFTSLRNYVRGEFINRRNCGKYPPGPIRRSYALIPLQKVVSLALSLVTAPFTALAVVKHRGSLDRCAVLFPIFLITSKIIALRVALWRES